MIATGFIVARRYLDNRYTGDPVWVWARTVHVQRIALEGNQLQYPLYGYDLSNYVQYVGMAGPHGEYHYVTDCAQWRAALRDGAYTYAVLDADHDGYVEHPETQWTRGLSGAVEILHAGTVTVFRLDRTSSVTSPTCS